MGTRAIVSARFWAWVAVVLGAWCAHGATANSAAFDQANKLYEQGKYAEAAVAYESYLASNAPTANVWFNLGNAAYKSGQLGTAIAAYRIAERMEPRDTALRANLEFVRSKIYSDERTRVPLWKRAVRQATINEWTLATAVCFWAMWCVLAGGEFTGRRYFKSAAVLFALALLAGSGLVSAIQDQHDVEAVVKAREATARFGPFDESQAAFQLRDGAEVTVLDAKGEWLQVRDVEKRVGWLRRAETIVVPTALATRP